MSITLITGLPGNAKTLYALQSIQKRALAENRDVYCSGVNMVSVPSQVRADGTMSSLWTEFDAKDWFSLPDNSLIFIDEAQDTFPKKPNGSDLPEYYKMLAKHRHTGKDIILATQHPSLVDNFVKRLVQQHFHAVRKFGFHRSTYYEWDKISDKPEELASQKKAVGSSVFKYPKEVYSWYKSASVHTVKRRVPLKLVLACLLVAVVAVYAYWSFSRFLKPKELVPVGGSGGSVQVVSGSVPSQATGGVAAKGALVPFDALEDARHWVAVATPRVTGLPQTAPKYDELTKPTRVPVPSMCIQSKTVCRCFTQQGTAMSVESSMCVEFARNGFFQEFDPDKDKQATQKSADSAAVLEKSPVGRPVASLGSSVAAFAYESRQPVAVPPVSDTGPPPAFPHAPR